MENKLKWFNSARGFTLVEILVSITILSIVVVTFLTLFVQSAKTNTASGKILEATYIAQSEIEQILNVSDTYVFNETLTELISEESLDFIKMTCGNSSADATCFAVNRGEHSVKVKIDSPDDGNISNLLVRVYNTSGNLEAQMETIIDWEETGNE